MWGLGWGQGEQLPLLDPPSFAPVSHTRFSLLYALALLCIESNGLDLILGKLVIPIWEKWKRMLKWKLGRVHNFQTSRREWRVLPFPPSLGPFFQRSSLLCQESITTRMSWDLGPKELALSLITLALIFGFFYFWILLIFCSILLFF